MNPLDFLIPLIKRDFFQIYNPVTEWKISLEIYWKYSGSTGFLARVDAHFFSCMELRDGLCWGFDILSDCVPLDGSVFILKKMKPHGKKSAKWFPQKATLNLKRACLMYHPEIDKCVKPCAL